MDTTDTYPHYVEIKVLNISIDYDSILNTFGYVTDPGHSHNNMSLHSSTYYNTYAMETEYGYHYSSYALDDRFKEWFDDQNLTVNITINGTHPARPTGAICTEGGVWFKEAKHAVAFKLRFG